MGRKAQMYVGREVSVGNQHYIHDQFLTTTVDNGVSSGVQVL